jgi:hypothetical protein
VNNAPGRTQWSATSPGSNWDFIDKRWVDDTQLNFDAMDDYASKYGGFDPTGAGTRFDPTDVFTTDQMQAQGEKEQKAKEQVTEDFWRLDEALSQMIGSTLAGADSMDQLEESLIRGLGAVANQGISEGVSGFFGPIAGGLAQFGFNMLAGGEEPLPIRDGRRNLDLSLRRGA